MALPNDPLFSSQWYLRNPKSGGLDLGVAAVWSPSEGPGYTGAGIRVAVVDTGIDYRHPDLAPRYDTARDHDFTDDGSDSFGTAAEAHGTAVTGIIGAARNGAGVVGVAYDATLTGYRTSPTISDDWLEDIRAAIAFAGRPAQAIDVVNISQTISNDPNSQFDTGYTAARFDAIEAAIGTTLANGRGGLGTPIVKAAGNAREDVYDVNADDWTNDTRQVVVGAVDRDGTVSSYSSYGSALLVSAFGTPGQVVTTDRTGSAGYVAGNFYRNFDGTSAAAPMVSGVVALMLDAAPGLGWRDVQSILAASARHVGSAIGGTPAEAEHAAWFRNHATTWNGGGLHYSNDYGYGLVDARAAVRLAETWALTGTAAAASAGEASASVDVLDGNRVVPDGKPAGLSFHGTLASGMVVERAAVQMSFSSAFVGDLDLYLTSPDGTTSQLYDGDLLDSNSYEGTWTFETQAFRGEHAAGQWTVRVADSSTGDRISVSDIVVRTFGAATVDDRYVFTGEYSDSRSGTVVIRDTNGGSDTANAAAVTSASTIRLDGVAGAIDGVATRLIGVEHAVGGDGADTILGSEGANRLHGMRGADRVSGWLGADTLDGGSGADTLVGGAGRDVLTGGAGRDVLIGGAAADRFVFTAASDSPADAASCDVLKAGGGAAAFENPGAAFGDRIDLSGIDADTTRAGDQAFVFGGTGRGHVWCVDSGTTTTVFANVDNDAAAEFRLDILDGGVRAAAYEAVDFIL